MNKLKHTPTLFHLRFLGINILANIRLSIIILTTYKRKHSNIIWTEELHKANHIHTHTFPWPLYTYKHKHIQVYLFCEQFFLLTKAKEKIHIFFYWKCQWAGVCLNEKFQESSTTKNWWNKSKRQTFRCDYKADIKQLIQKKKGIERERVLLRTEYYREKMRRICRRKNCKKQSKKTNRLSEEYKGKSTQYRQNVL